MRRWRCNASRRRRCARSPARSRRHGDAQDTRNAPALGPRADAADRGAADRRPAAAHRPARPARHRLRLGGGRGDLRESGYPVRDRRRGRLCARRQWRRGARGGRLLSRHDDRRADLHDRAG